MKIAYEKHPVSVERKAELRSQGYTIIDARFKPASEDDVPTPAVAVQEPVEAPVEPPKAAESDAVDYESLTADELHAIAKERGVKVHANAGKEKVIDALKGV